MNKELGTKITPSDEILDMFAPVEGANAVYYGKVRNGKTRNATADILELLMRGEIVYANWKIEFPDYDERRDFKSVFIKTFFGRKYFFKYKKENFHFIDPDELITGDGEININYLNRLVGVHLFIDEGQWVLPSMVHVHDAENVAKMKLVLHGGHHCRSLNIITQRASNISKNTRSQINIWYRCVKKMDAFGYMIFQRFAIEDMKDDMPIEFDDEGEPLGEVKNYFVNKRKDIVFKAYNTHAMRAKDAIEEPSQFEVYETSAFDRVRLLVAFLWPFGKRVRREAPRRLPERFRPLGSVREVKEELRVRMGMKRLDVFDDSL